MSEITMLKTHITNLLLDNKKIKNMLEKNNHKLDKTFDKLININEEIRDIKDKIDDKNLIDMYEELIDSDDELINEKQDNTKNNLLIKEKNNQYIVKDVINLQSEIKLLIISIRDVIENNWKDWLYNEIDKGIKYVERENSNDY